MEIIQGQSNNAKELRNSTLVFLIKKTEDRVSEICLAMKKRGFGVNRWNGVGGKVEQNESIIQAAIRETQEEIGVQLENISKIAELTFYFANNPDWDQKVHVYFSEKWEGIPHETEEMKPQWFEVADIPFQSMWPDDEFWIPQVLQGKNVQATFIFGEQDKILDQKVNIVESI